MQAVERFNHKDFIYKEWRQAQYLHFVQRGRVLLYPTIKDDEGEKMGVSRGVLYSGSPVGSLFGLEVQSSSRTYLNNAQAIGDTEVLKVTAIELRRDPSLLRRYVQETANYAMWLNRRVDFLTKPVSVRVASILLELAVKQRIRDIFVPFSQEEVAQLAGTTLITAREALFDPLKASGVLSESDAGTYIRNRKLLIRETRHP